PLTVDPHTPTDVQIMVQAVQDDGRRPFTLHSRTSTTGGLTEWTLHASGALSAQKAAIPDTAAAPVGIEAIDTDSFYDELAEQGFHYQSPFRAVRGISLLEGSSSVYAEVALPADTDTTGYGIHPALLDAALHPLAAAFYDTDPGSDPPTARLPFAFHRVTLHAIGAARLRVQLTRTGPDTFTLHATDPAGAPVITIDTLTLRPRPDHLSAPPPAALGQSLFELDWPGLPEDTFPPTPPPSGWAVITSDPDRLPASLTPAAPYRELTHPDLAHTDLVIWPLPPPEPDHHDPLPRLHTLTQHTLTQLQQWLTRPDTLSTPLVIITTHAVCTTVYDQPPDLAHAALWALIHTAQNEHPARITALDIDTTTATDHTLGHVLAALADPARRSAVEPQLALRDGVVHTPRLTPSQTLTPPPTPTWHLRTTAPGGLNSLTLAPTAPVPELAPGHIRVAIRAAGLSHRDLDTAADPDTGIGREGAGVVLDTAPDVTTIAPGDTVMGLFPHNAAATTAITDHRLVTAIPAGWSFTQAAAAPVAFLTAYTTLIDHAHLHPGQRVLIHTATGGVGHAALQIARHLGADTYTTASPPKHPLLHKLGIPDDHIASSRTPDFADTFHHATHGHGMDIILHTLAPDLLNDSLHLLAPGGHLIDLTATTDPPTPHTHPDATYHTYDLNTTPPDHIAATWTALTPLLSSGALHPLPTTSYGLTHARHALTDLTHARHTGKIVLTPPPTLTPHGTVLITGGTGMLGALFAEHLITHHGVRHLLLASRRGPHAPGAHELHQHLTHLGAHVTITACDTSNPTQLHTLLTDIPTTHPLTAIIHTAATLHDAVLTDITPTQLHTVLTAKADTAWHLHHLTTTTPLDTLILFSSVAAVLGAPGQGAYAAANAFLDALAHHRHHQHHPTTSLAWGYWQTPSAMTAHLSTLDHTRMTRNGLTPITTDHGLTLFDTALTHHHPHQIPTPLNKRTLTHQARQHTLPPLLSTLTTTRPHATTTNTLTTELTGHTPQHQRATLTHLILTTTATVLAHPDPTTIDPDQPFTNLGIDSLTALQLRNTLTHHTGLPLPATLVFDHPTPTALTNYLLNQLTQTTTPTA
ncbi:SDR family NAD(P)-dependent oxidoreductase, partial [Mycobacterium sp. ML4]